MIGGVTAHHLALGATDDQNRSETDTSLPDYEHAKGTMPWVSQCIFCVGVAL